LNKPLQVGVTGGIGAGKSLICKVFALLGIPVYDADSRAKKVMTTDGILMDAIKKEFGVLSFLEDGTLNTKYLSNHVFTDDSKLRKLNELVHPKVTDDYNSWLAKHAKAPYVIKEAALLFETGTYKLLDEIILVAAPELLRIRRVLNRDYQRTEEQIRNIMNKQIEVDKAKEMSTHLIINDESKMVIPQVLALHKKFLRN
jgi:dephospho-CoA kinase